MPEKTIVQVPVEFSEGEIRKDKEGTETVIARAVGPEGSAQLKFVGTEPGWLDERVNFRKAHDVVKSSYECSFDSSPAEVAIVALPYIDEDGEV